MQQLCLSGAPPIPYSGFSLCSVSFWQAAHLSAVLSLSRSDNTGADIIESIIMQSWMSFACIEVKDDVFILTRLDRDTQLVVWNREIGTHEVIYWPRQNNPRHLYPCVYTRCLCMCVSGAMGWMCIICAHKPFLTITFAGVSCAIRASDVGPQALQAMSSVTIHVWQCCVPVSAVRADLTSASHERKCQICTLPARTLWHISVSVVTMSCESMDALLTGKSHLTVSLHSRCYILILQFILAFCFERAWEHLS